MAPQNGVYVIKLSQRFSPTDVQHLRRLSCKGVSAALAMAAMKV